MWDDLRLLMTDLEIEERHVRATHLDAGAVSLDGPVDVALCAVAREERASHQDVLVLTLEENVAKWMARSESRVMTLLQVMDQLRST